MSIIIKGGSNSQLANVDTLGNLQVLSTPAAISSVAAPWTSATTDNTAQVLFNTGGWAATIVQLNQTSTITGGAVTFEGTYDGINWESLPATFVLDPQLYTQIVNPYVLTANTNQAVLLVAGGFQQLRVRLDPVILGTGQVTIYWTLLASSPIRNSNSFSLTGSIPAGSNTIGAVTQDATAGPWVQNLTQVGGTAIGLGSDTSANSFPVVIASDQAAIPVSQSGAPWSQNLTYVGGSAISLGSAVSADSIPVVIASDQGAVTVAQSNAANLKATVSQAGSWAVSVSNFPATQPVSSTQLPATLDGDGNLMVAVQGTVPVSGTFWQSVQPVSGTVTANISGSISNTAFGVTGDVAIVNSTTPGSTKIAVTADPITFAAPQHTIVDSGTITANQGGTWNIGTVTNPVTVTQGTAANLNATVVGTGTFAVQAAQTGTWNVRVQDGSGNALTSTSSALDVNIKSGGGTVQYAAGATAATPTGTVAMGMFGTSVQPLQLDSNSYLKVNVVGGITVTGGSFTSASDGPTGSAVPADASYLGYRDGSGNLVGVGTTTPLPITGSITATDASVGVVGAASPADATQMGFNSGGNLTVPSTTTPLPVLAAGSHTDNNAAPSTDNIGALVAVSSYASPVKTNGNLTSLSVDTSGYLRTRSNAANPLGDGVSMPRQNQIEVNFSQGFNSALVTNTLTGSATAVAANGTAVYATGITSNSRSIGSTIQQLNYHPGHSWYAYFTASFTTGGPSGSWQRIGPFNSTDGFYLGYEGSVLNFTQLQNGTPTHVANASWNGDPVDGTSSSAFTSGGSPVAIDTTKINIYRIHGAWFGVSPIALEVFSPDGVWVNLHTFRFPNTLTSPFMYTTNLNLQVDVNNASNTSNLSVNTPCWAVGVVNESSSSNAVKANAGVWNSGTPNNSSITIVSPYDSGTLAVGFVQTTTITGGTVQFQVSDDNTNWYVVNGVNVQTQQSASSYTFHASTNAMFIFDMTGRAYFRLYMTSAILGTGQVTAQYGTTDSVSSTVQVSGAVVITSLPGQTTPGFAIPTNTLMIAGTDGTDARNLLVDTSGRLQNNIAQVAGVSLGASAVVNYGSTPAASAVPGVNAYVTNTVPVSQSGTWTNRVVGNAGAIFDAVVGGTQPANLLQVGGQTTTANPTYSTTTQNPLSLTPSGGVRTDITSVAGTAVTAVPSTFGSNPTGSVQGVNASIFAGTTSVPSGTFGTNPTAVAGTLPVNASLFIGTTAVVTTGTAGQIKVGISGATGVTLDAAQNASAPANELVVGGVFNTTVPALSAGNATQFQTDSTGSQFVNTEGRKATYRIGVIGFTPIASATAPTFSIVGSASKTVRITKIRVSASASTGAVSNMSLYRFSALSGGTSASQTANIAKLDSTNGASSAVPSTWSVAATTATSAGILAAERYELVTDAVSVNPGYIEWDFGDKNGQSLVLSGTSEFVGVLFSAVGTTPVADCWVEWLEE